MKLSTPVWHLQHLRPAVSWLRPCPSRFPNVFLCSPHRTLPLYIHSWMHPSLRCRAAASFWVNILLSGDLFNFNLSFFFSGELNVVVPLRGHVNRVGVVREGDVGGGLGKAPVCVSTWVWFPFLTLPAPWSPVHLPPISSSTCSLSTTSWLSQRQWIISFLSSLLPARLSLHAPVQLHRPCHRLQDE